MSARERIRQTAERWFLVDPLLFALWTTHELVIEPSIQTIRVRQGRVEYNPDFINRLDKRQLEAVLRFEAVRILLKHPYQRRKENHQTAYLASNLTLQEYLQSELPFPRARDLFGSNEFDQQYFEFYYYKLLENRQGAGGRGQEATDNNQQSTSSGQSSISNSSDGSDLLLEAYTNAETTAEENTEDWDEDEFLSDRINDQIRVAQESNRWGTIAGKLRERVLATLRPKLDYRAVLRHFRTSILSLKRVLTRMKPSRRYGFLYMGSRRDFTTRLLFAVDVSGSIASEDLRRGFSVINQFFKYGIEQIDVIQFDTEIKSEPLELKKALHRLAVLGRGGTDFTPVIEYIDEHREYDGLVIFTDGIAPVPPMPKNRRTRILWLFNHEANYERMHKGLREIGQAVFLKEDRKG